MCLLLRHGASAGVLLVARIGSVFEDKAARSAAFPSESAGAMYLCVSTENLGIMGRTLPNSVHKFGALPLRVVI